MSAQLEADFQKHYRGGATVQAKFSQPHEGFYSTVLFGPSGSGKTTILRCLAGLERPEQGTIRLGDEIWFDSAKAIHLRPQERGIGFLFQDYALFPHLTIAGNIGYGIGQLSRPDRKKRTAHLLELLEMPRLENRYPHQLSSGQQQRVALARAVAPKPRLLLLDEPLSALDAPTRQALRRQLRGILTALKTPVVVVTHDALEAVALADQAVVLSTGRVCQCGPVHEVFSRPADPTVARIVGIETIEPGMVLRVVGGLASVRVGEVELLAVTAGIAVGPVYACIRGEEVTLERGDPPQTSARNRLAVRVVSVVPEGPTVRVTLDGGFRLTALITQHSVQQLAIEEGTQLTALIKAQAVHLVPR
jgi:molybdate transport system ATP-binding protein